MKPEYFVFDDLKVNKKGEVLIVKGKVAVADHVHAHSYSKDKTFRSYFTTQAIEKMANDIKLKPVYVDVLHQNSIKINNDYIIEQILKTNPELENELKAIKSNLDIGKFPLFKISEVNLAEDSLEVTLESNPLYKEIDEAHKKVYDIITGSVESGHIKGFSANFVPKEVIDEEGIDKINDLDFFGISLVDAPALGESTCFAEVATRSIKKIVEIRKGSENMDEKVEPKVDEKVVEKIIHERLDAELKRREAEVLARRKEEEEKSLKEEVEKLKREKEEFKAGSKGVPKQEKQFSSDEIREKIKNLSESDLIRLYAEFISNDSNPQAPPLIKRATHKGRRDDPHNLGVTWEYEEPSYTMAEMHRNLMRSRDVDLKFN